MAEVYYIPSGAAPTTSQFVVIDTTSTLKTILQVKLGGSQTNRAKVVEWGVSYDASAAAVPVLCELLTTGTVKATVTEHLAGGIHNLDQSAVAVTDDNPFAFGVGDDETGYNGSAEGTITATKLMDVQQIPPTGGFIKQMPLGREWSFKPADFLRIRVKAAAAVNCVAYVHIEV